MCPNGGEERRAQRTSRRKAQRSEDSRRLEAALWSFLESFSFGHSLEQFAGLLGWISRRPPQIQRQRKGGVAFFDWDRHLSRRMPDIAKPGQTATLRLEGVNGKLFVS